MNAAQVIADLRAAGRAPQLPVRLEMQAGDVLTLERPLRLVPGPCPGPEIQPAIRGTPSAQARRAAYSARMPW